MIHDLTLVANRTTVYIPVVRLATSAMPFRPKLVTSEARILAELGTSPSRIYTPSEIARHFRKAKSEQVLAKNTTLDEFVQFLVRRRRLLSISLKSKKYEKTVTRYGLGKPSPYLLAASFKKSGFLSHGTAAYLHNLLKRPPGSIYLNVEQSAKPPHDTALTQTGIDRAFAGKQRQSTLSYENGQLSVTILAGKSTGRLGVIPASHPEALGAQVTNLERTLVDIAVRPVYAGGITHVLAAYRRAVDRASLPHLVSVLEKLRYAYPYSQAIGFLLERAGYRNEELKDLRANVSQFDFYLCHGIKDPAYDTAWKLFYPRELS